MLQGVINSKVIAGLVNLEGQHSRGRQKKLEMLKFGIALWRLQTNCDRGICPIFREITTP